MTAKVKLDNIIEALEFQSEETSAWLDRQAGEIHYVGPDEQRLLDDWDDEGEEDDELDDADAEGEGKDDEEDLDTADPAAAIAKLIAADTSNRFITLPSKYDVHEYQALEQFAYAQTDPQAANDLTRAIRGSGAFRYFKDTVHRLELTKEWYAFRDQYYRDFAREWCEEEGIEYE